MLRFFLDGLALGPSGKGNRSIRFRKLSSNKVSDRGEKHMPRALPPPLVDSRKMEFVVELGSKISITSSD